MKFCAPLALSLLASVTLLPAAEAIPWENPGLEDGMEAWVVQRGTISVVPEAAHAGTAGIRIVGNTPATLGQSPIPIEGGKTYRLQFWVRGLEHSHSSVMIAFQQDSGRGISPENADDFKKAISPTKEWKQFSMDFTAPEWAASAVFKIGVWPKAGSATTDNIDLDDFSLEEVTGTP